MDVPHILLHCAAFTETRRRHAPAITTALTALVRSADPRRDLRERPLTQADHLYALLGRRQPGIDDAPNNRGKALKNGMKETSDQRRRRLAHTDALERMVRVATAYIWDLERSWEERRRAEP